jgi:D-alanyl-lipoteichoic acid acyltransferase DltB (MBOAT superfamily)
MQRRKRTNFMLVVIGGKISFYNFTSSSLFVHRRARQMQRRKRTNFMLVVIGGTISFYNFTSSSLFVRRRARQMQRRKRTNFMLVLVSLTFFISWAPLNIFNIILDLTNAFKV